MTNTKNNLPQFEEQQFINQEQLNLQEILSQFKQPIPNNNFIQIATDYIFTTKSK
jgi:hypothetical protein